MVDMFIILRTCMEMMHEYEGVKIMCNYCPVCNTIQIDFAFDAVQIFAHRICPVKETDEALTKLYELFYDFILQSDVVKYLREGTNHDHNRRPD